MVAPMFHQLCPFLANGLRVSTTEIEKKWGGMSVAGRRQVALSRPGWGVAFGAWAGAGGGQGKHGLGATPSGGRGIQSVSMFS